MKEMLFGLMAKISGQAYNPAWEEKIASLLTAGLSVVVFTILFLFLFYKYTKSDYEARRLGIVSISILSFFVVGKFILYRVGTGYIPDRLLFYALPSPKVQNIFWLFAVLVVFWLFMKLREGFGRLKTNAYLIFLLIIFFLFTTAVAGVREGEKSITDTLSRTKWEYSGNVALVENTHDFLRDYVSLLPKLAMHSTTHPPAYSLLLYYFHKLFNVSLLGMSLLVILTGGLSIFPIYFALKEFFEEKIVRNVLQIFIFIPSIVMFCGTSLEAFFLSVVWTAIALVLIGWRKSMILSVIGGFALDIAMMSNFLFLLTAPIFPAILWYTWRENDRHKQALVILRASASFLAFVVFFVILWKWSGYSIIENFQVSHAANQEAVISNFDSAGIYFTFMAMNILTFFLALGIANLSVMAKKWHELWQRNRPELYVGFAYVAFLLAIGVFQGEIERLWMFVVPFFLPAIARATEKISHRQFSSLISLLFFQVVIIQILFYTYW